MQSETTSGCVTIDWDVIFSSAGETISQTAVVSYNGSFVKDLYLVEFVRRGHGLDYLLLNMTV